MNDLLTFDEFIHEPHFQLFMSLIFNFGGKSLLEFQIICAVLEMCTVEINTFFEAVL